MLGFTIAPDLFLSFLFTAKADRVEAEGEAEVSVSPCEPPGKPEPPFTGLPRSLALAALGPLLLT